MKKKTLADFIQEAIAIHGDKYDYSKVVYINNNTPVCIICPIHGEFWQSPKNHLKGYGCPSCGHERTNNKNRLSFEGFISKAREVHGDKYDYSKVVYINNSTKVCIICPIHGEFWMTPANHINGQGCPKCGHIQQGVGRRIDEGEILMRFRKVHGSKYDYSQMVYIDTLTKIYIICPIHGGFWQTPENHFNGCGCPFCAGNILKTREQFITESNKIHGDKYDYSKVKYLNCETKVCIICPIHGEFWQTPAAHLNGCGCPKCVGKNKTTEEFVNELKMIFGDKYDFSKVVYKGAFIKVCVICPIHGEFWITPHALLSGNGCCECGINKRADKQRKTFKQFCEDVDKIYGEGYVDLSKAVYINAHTPIIISTPYIGEIEITPNRLLCKKLYKLLRESYLEHRVRLYLQEHNINFQTQKRFKWLVDKGQMRLDFFLTDYNIAIECQGVQHFVPIKHFKMDFEGQRRRDDLKFSQCKKNNIHIYYYTEEEYLKYSDVDTIYLDNIFSNMDDIKNKII